MNKKNGNCNPKLTISLITVCFNSALTLEDTIISVLSQTYPEIEYIIVDGGSMDGTLNIIKKYNETISFWSSEPDKGLYDAMNKGIEMATGEIIGLINSDDFYPANDIISVVMDQFTVNKIDILYGDLNYVSPSNPKKIIRRWVAKSWKRNKFKLGWMPPHPTLFVRKKVYEQYGKFNIDLKLSADYEFMIRTMYCGNDLKIVYLPMFLVHMRIGGVGNATLQNRLNANREDKLAWKLNAIDPPFYTTILKPVRKINQFIFR
ncbi:MAG: glycosyltransferase [Lewinellaceae bacterium]|nr:glycosyltransferase [Lewinellaceae bacterium]